MESKTDGMDHSEKLSSALDDLRKTETACDFMIKVGEELFPVHRNVLIAASDYFRAMLSHDTKERQEGVVDMKEVEPDAVKLCIKFMYTGSTSVTMETVETLLPAAGIMQLNALSEYCVEVLEKNLEAENCISVLRLARTHSFTNLEEKALELFRENYNFEKFGDFAELEKEGLVERISDFSLRNELAWEVIINWIKLNVEDRSKDILEFVKLLDWESSPSAELLKKFWSELIFLGSKPCKKLLFRRVFSDLDELKLFLSVDNFFVIRSLSIAYQDITKQARKIIDEFLTMNIVQLFKDDASLSLTEDEFFAAFVDHDTLCLCNEDMFWKIAVKWCKNDRIRRTLFPKLMKAVRFDRLDKSFLETSVRNETLLTENPECVKIFIDAVSSQILQSEDATYMAVLYPDGKIFAMELKEKSWKPLPAIDLSEMTFFEMFAFNNKLCVIVDRKLMYFNTNRLKWIKREAMQHLPDEKARIVATNKLIYVVEKDRLSIYDPITNEWDETLPGCELEEPFFAGVSNKQFIAINIVGEYKLFNILNNSWGNVKKVFEASVNTSVAYSNEKIYVVGLVNNNSPFFNKMQRFDGEKWKTFDLPTATSSQSFSFIADNRLMLLVSGVLYIYDDVGDSWGTLLSDFPKYVSGGIGQFDDISSCSNPISVCSFKADSSFLDSI